ncbi:MAG: class I SAM-dependent methyltransferase [Saprospiraceae bacterium]|nr:class I SAM-dependent methyltransferase [Saprospiraceae bacterium]
MSAHVSEQDIIKYYDTCESDYRLLWHLSEQQAMHYGYWTEETGLLRDALKNMNAFVLSKLIVKSGDRILDAGCGVGGSVLYAAQHWNCEAWGITLSDKQCKKAEQNANERSLLGKAHFAVQNYCHTNFENDSFHGVYGIESICHANSKAEFLREAYRLLKPGGRLVVADFFRTAKSKNHQKEYLMEKWAQTWAIPDFSYWHLFLEEASNVGLELTGNFDISRNIYKSARRLYYYFYPGLVCHFVLRLFGLRTKVQGKNMWSTFYQYKSLKEGLWEYRVLQFEKK